MILSTILELKTGYLEEKKGTADLTNLHLYQRYEFLVLVNQLTELHVTELGSYGPLLVQAVKKMQLHFTRNGNFDKMMGTGKVKFNDKHFQFKYSNRAY